MAAFVQAALDGVGCVIADESLMASHDSDAARQAL
jgi:hypothetical protein